MVSGRGRAIALLVLMAFMIAAFAVQPAQAVTMKSESQKVQLQYEKPQTDPAPSVFWMIIQMLLALGLIVFLAWGFIQVLGRKMNTKAQGRWIRVVDEVVVGQNKGIMALEIGGRAFLIGVTDHHISMLLELDDQKLVEDMIAAGYEDQAPASELVNTFVSKLRTSITGEQRSEVTGFHHVLDDKVRNLERMSNRLRGIGDKNEGEENGRQ